MNKLHTWKSKRLATLLSGVFMVSLQLLSGKASAQTLAHYIGTGGTSTSVTGTTNVTVSALTATGLGTNSPCGSGGLSGLTNNGVTTYNSANGHVYFTITANSGYQLNLSSFSCKLRRSGSGLAKVRMAYQTTGGVVNDLLDRAPDNVGCGAGSSVFNWATGGGGSLPTGVSSVTIDLYPYAPIAAGGTIQINDITIGGTATAVGPTCSMVTGSVTPTTAAVCKNTAQLLTLSGGSTGSGVTFQWQSSVSGSGIWSNISGATNTTYNAPNAANGTFEYRNVASCSVSTVTATSATATVTVTSPNAGSVTPSSSVISVGDSLSLSNGSYSGGTGVWSSGTTSVGDFTIDPFAVPGIFVSSHVGTSLVTFTVTDGGGCVSTTTANVTVVFPGDLAIYLGTGGTSTGVVTIANASSTALTATGFGTNSPCGSGGLSGLTMSTSITSYAEVNPNFSYTVTPTPGKVLNATKFYVKSRSSGTGPTKGILAYRVNGVGSFITEPSEHALSTSGSCGANTNSWSWTPSVAINGATKIEVRFYPYTPGAGTGTIQLNQLEVIGNVTDSAICTGVTTATVTPSATYICDSGYYASTSFTGVAGTGISYQWQSSTDGSSWSNISGASNIYYTSPVQTDSTYYRLVTTCTSYSGTVVATSPSATDSLLIITHPSAIDNSGISEYPYITMGAPETFTDATAGGLWGTQHFSIAAFADSTIGDITGLIPGFTKVNYYFLHTIGCTTNDSVKVKAENSITAYTGKFGNSTTVDQFSANLTVSAVTAVGFGTNGSCSEGGVSGLTVGTALTTYGSANAHVGYKIKANTLYGINMNEIHATTRSSAQGPTLLRIAYSIDGGTTWVDNGSDLTAENTFGCGISTVDQTFILSTSVTLADSILIEVYPFAPGSGTGTFQLNALDVVGSVEIACPTPDPIVDNHSTFGLDGELYGYDCTSNPILLDGPIVLTGSPAGGTWSTTTPSLVTVDASGFMNIVATGLSSDAVASITYTSSCGSSITATFTISASPGSSCDGTNLRPAAPTTVSSDVTGVTVYPNPTSNMLNIISSDKVNVSILSMDGRTLINKNDASAVNVSSLANGAYMIQVYNQKNTLIKTVKFTKE